MMYLLEQFTLALFATLGFSVIFRVPLKKIPACVIVGALGWLTYIIAVNYLESPVFGCFMGACTVGLFSSIFARALKEAATVFIIPGSCVSYRDLRFIIRWRHCFCIITKTPQTSASRP